MADQTTELLRVEDLQKTFPRGNRTLKAVDHISFSLRQGETLGLVGESGSGKSTLGRTVLRLHEPTGGRVLFEGKDLSQLNRQQMRDQRRHMQLIFQDPLAALNPQMTIGQAIEDPLIIHKVGTPAQRRDLVLQLLDTVGIGREFIDCFPYEFSGGQQQRVGIARALALQPKFLVCDEPVSALDVSIQAQIIKLLVELRKEYHLSYLFIAHDLGVIKYLSDRVAVMYLGKIVQLGATSDVFSRPAHPYTKAMIESVPRIPKDGRPGQRFSTLQGEIPSPIDLPRGCRFAGRCPVATARCTTEEPALRELTPGHLVACHLA